LFRIFNDATGHTQIQYKKLSTDDQWHPSPDEKPLEIFQIQSGEQIIPIGQPDVVPEHIDENEIKSFQRSMEKDFQLAAFGEDEVQSWKTYFDHPMPSSHDHSQWPLDKMVKYKAVEGRSSLSDKEKSLLEAYKTKRQEFKMV
ncbi:hypothetical protein FSP39_002516, partial [Pinctada imbricata]